MSIEQYNRIKRIATIQAIKWTAITFCICWCFGLLIMPQDTPAPLEFDASAAYTDTTEPAHGLVDVAPHFAGLEAGFSSESIHFVNEYGDCGWEVNECWLTTFIGAAIPHNLLDGATHPDTVAQAATRGSIVVANATPAWDELVVGAVGEVVTTDGVDTFFASVAAITAGTWFLYDNASADIAGYSTLFPDPIAPPVGFPSFIVLIPASPTLIEEFATEIGEPGITFINDGLIEFHFHARRQAGTMDIRVYAEIYTRTHPVGIETLIATTELSNILTNVQAGYEVHADVAFTPMAVTDRLVVKVYGNQYPPGANPTVEFYVEALTATRIELPGADTGSALSHTVAAVPFGQAQVTPIILEAGVSEAGADFFVEVTAYDANSDMTWPAFGSRIPVADFVTFYWGVDTNNLTCYVSNDTQRDINAVVWWTR